MSTKIEINDNTSVKPNAGLAYVITAVDANGKPTATKLIYEKEHTYDWDNPLESFEGTCTEEGYVIYPCVRYSECGGTYTEYTGTLEHTYEHIEGDFDDAYHYYTCSECGDQYRASHEYSTSTVAPTCGKDGKITYTCTVCGQQYEETIPATGNHTWGPWFPEIDIYHNRECTRCGQLYDSSGIGIPCELTAIDDDQHKCFTCGRTEDHSYGNSSICGMCGHACSHSNMTYTANYEEYSAHDYFCPSCLLSSTEPVTCSLQDYNFPDTPSLDANCFTAYCPICDTTWEYGHLDTDPTNPYEEADYICNACGIEMCTHSEVERKITQTATCTETGLIEKICTNCGKSLSQTILPINSSNHTAPWGDSTYGGCNDCKAQWCLIEGTLITMADGSQKPIEDVKSGDLIMSYDPNTKQNVEAVVVSAYKTGEANKFDVYTFSDGNVLSVYGEHGAYNDETGHPFKLPDITRKHVLLNSSGERVKWTQTTYRSYHGYPKARYNLISSNNLYYANNILLGNSAFVKLEYFIRRGLDKRIPEDILKPWLADVDQYNDYSSFKNDPEFNREAKDLLAKKAMANSVIKNNKARLEKSDYKVQKYTEGKISSEEFEKSKDDRDIYRKRINAQEDILAENTKAYEELVNKYRKGATYRSIFEDCCKRDNALLETIKNYVAENGSFVSN